MLVECKDCNVFTDGEAISEYEHFYEEHLVQVKYFFLRCPKCFSPILMSQVNHVDDGDDWGEPHRLYPPIDANINRAIPNNLRLIYEETLVCFKAKAYTATAIMCRKVVQGIADENEITGHNLADILKNMKKEGIIENRLYEWADALRLSGNDAAHKTNIQINHQDAKDILEFTHALLEYLFSFQEKFEQFKNRQNLNLTKKSS